MPKAKTKNLNATDSEKLARLSPIEEEPCRMNSTVLKRKAGVFDETLFSPGRSLMSPLKSLKLSPIKVCDMQNVSMAKRVPLSCVSSKELAESTTSSEDDIRRRKNAGTCTSSSSTLGKHYSGINPAKVPTESNPTYRGQMKLSVYSNSGLLTVHLIQGRHLKPLTNLTCDSFVRVSLHPDDTNRTMCKTDLVYDSTNPIYDEKFSFELLDADTRKRLLVSCWNKTNGGTEFIGCMSFGLQHIVNKNKTVNGWYFLLDEHVGHRKHLQVNTKKQHSASTDKENYTIPKVNQDVMWMDTHMLIVRRGSKGFGFTITGSSPVQVCRVEPESTAELAGVMQEDFIVRINGMNVSRSTSESVARIIRHAQRKVVLEVQRPQKLKREAPAPELPSFTQPSPFKKPYSTGTLPMSRQSSKRDKVKQIFKVYKERKASHRTVSQSRIRKSELNTSTASLASNSSFKKLKKKVSFKVNAIRDFI